MNQDVMQAILEKIRAYSRIFLFRHTRLDGDCVGATKGLKAILSATFPEKEIILTDGQTSDYLSFLGPDDAPVDDYLYAGALGIVLDTASLSRISNPQHALCREIIKIDHHPDIAPYGDIAWVEPERSSTCEMIAAFYDAFREQLTLPAQAALYLYTGMVTDSGRFRYESVSGDSLRLAGLMLDRGIDTQWLYAQLYLGDFEALKFKAYVYENVARTENGVAHFFVSRETQEKFGLNYETASAAISYLDAIRGCLCWIAFIENDDEEQSIRVRLRSRFVAINQVAERYRGGGHACASGATVFGRDEMAALVAEADQVVKQYKESHAGWL